MTDAAKLVALVLLAALAACNTPVQGVGRDLQSGGAALSNSAQDVQSQL